MVKTVLIRTIGGHAITAACVMLAACAPNPQPVQAIPPGPTPDEVADYAAAQMRYRLALAAGDGDVVAKANNTFRQVPREILLRQDPRLFEAEMVCERYRVAGPTATSRSMPTLADPQCQNIDWRYSEATSAIRQDLEARITAADSATLAQMGASHP
jgi:hypothetical protein